MHWLELLQARVKGSSQAAVARELGLSRSAISQVLSGTYPACTNAIAKKVLDTFGDVACPHLGQAIPAMACLDFQGRAIPTSNPHALNHWAACQACPHNTHRKDHP